ncbi:MAG: DUF370 domain-containing protein, partial [Oscillospiraceae bacterium]
MKLINIGFGNMVSANRLVAIVSPESAPIKRIIQDAKERATLVDATYGRRTRAVIITDSDHVILSAIQPETVANRINDGDNLHFVVSPKGNKRWDLRYKSPASRKWTWLGLGTYPQVSGKRARLQAQEWLQKIADGIDPIDYKNKQKQIENGEAQLVELEKSF